MTDRAYQPDTTNVGNVEFRASMIEAAWDYCQLVLKSGHQRGLISQTLAALAIEIVLKSYNSVVAGNAGKINEKYAFKVPAGKTIKDKHDLVELKALLREDVCRYLVDHFDEETIIANRDFFKTSRYCYEPDAPRSTSDASMKLAIKLICKTIQLYRDQGCDDPFIRAFDVSKAYWDHVQRRFLA